MTRADRADGALERLVAPGMLAVGIRLRRRVEHWEDPPRLDGRHVVLTGATSGIGRAAAAAYVRLGANLTVIARSRARAGELERELSERSEHSAHSGDWPRVRFELADMADLGAVATAGRSIAVRGEPVDVLVHNAGALSRSHTLGPSGVEVTVSAQVLAVWLLTHELRDVLSLGGNPAAVPRVLTMTSGGMYTVRHELGALEAGPDRYDGRKAYARAKRAQVVLTEGWARAGSVGDMPSAGSPVFHAVDPGWVGTTALREGLPGFARITGPALRTPEEGADTLVWLAGSPEGAAQTGCVWRDRRPRPIDRVGRTALTPDENRRAFAELDAWCAARIASAGVDLSG